MGLNSCLPLLDASCFLLHEWLIGTANFAVYRFIDFRGRRCFLRWILCASPHIRKATAELQKMRRCIRMNLCISSEDNPRHRVASAPATTESRKALVFEETMSRGGMREIGKTMNGRWQSPAVSSNPRSTGHQVSLSGSSFKEQKNTGVRRMQLICGLPCQRPFVG